MATELGAEANGTRVPQVFNGRPITDRQREILGLIRESINTRGFAPTLRELGAATGIRSTNGVSDHLKALERKGYIERSDGALSRGIRLVGHPDCLTENPDFCLPSEETPPIVYFAQSIRTLLIKIGTTSNLPGRIRQLQELSSGPVMVLHVFPGGFEEERAMHQRFTKLRAYSEWFTPDPELVEFIRAEQKKEAPRA